MTRFVFAGPEWLAFMGEQLDALAAQHRDELKGANYIMSQNYTNGPKALGVTAWWFRALEGELRWGIGALPAEVCDCYVEADYARMARTAVIDTEREPGGQERLSKQLAEWIERGEMIGFDHPERRPPFLFKMHNILARVTKTPS
jgi:hypothetical protein